MAAIGQSTSFTTAEDVLGAVAALGSNAPTAIAALRTAEGYLATAVRLASAALSSLSSAPSSSSSPLSFMRGRLTAQQALVMAALCGRIVLSAAQAVAKAKAIAQRPNAITNGAMSGRRRAIERGQPWTRASLQAIVTASSAAAKPIPSLPPSAAHLSSLCKEALAAMGAYEQEAVRGAQASAMQQQVFEGLWAAAMAPFTLTDEEREGVQAAARDMGVQFCGLEELETARVPAAAARAAAGDAAEVADRAPKAPSAAADLAEGKDATPLGLGSAHSLTLHLCAHAPVDLTASLLADYRAVVAAIDLTTHAVLASMTGDRAGLVQATLPAILASLTACLAALGAYLASPRYMSAPGFVTGESQAFLAGDAWDGRSAETQAALLSMAAAHSMEKEDAGLAAVLASPLRPHRVPALAHDGLAGTTVPVAPHVRPAVAALQTALISSLTRIARAMPVPAYYESLARQLPSPLLVNVALAAPINER